MVSTIVGMVGQVGVQPGPLPARVNQPGVIAASSDGVFLVSEYSVLRAY
jgi:hypothetical protein